MIAANGSAAVEGVRLRRTLRNPKKAIEGGPRVIAAVTSRSPANWLFEFGESLARIDLIGRSLPKQPTTIGGNADLVSHGIRTTTN